MSALASFKNVFHGLSPEQGEMRLTHNGLAWQGSDTKKVVTVTKESMRAAQWTRVARGFQLRLLLSSDKRRETFDGFEREDHEKLAHICKQHWELSLETREMSYRGWNWGEYDIQSDDLAFLVATKPLFEIPLTSIANSNIAGKTEVSLEFLNPEQLKPDPAAPKRRRAGDELVEMRFYVPGTVERDEGKEDDEEGEEEVSAAQAFYELVKKKAEIGQVLGEYIVEFNDVLLLTPRGRYDLDVFPTFVRLRGKTYDYKILHTSVTRLFLLPKPDDIHIQLVVGLDPPIHQGQTRYPYLVMQFTREDNLEVELKIDDEQLQKYGGKLQKEYDAPVFQIVSNIFRALTGRKLQAPSDYKSFNGQSGVKANMKATQGDLYFLDKNLIFVAKQPAVVDYADIHTASFSRVGGGMSSAKTFDLQITQKSSTGDLTFSSIPKEEHAKMEEYLRGKKVRVKNEMQEELAQVVGLSEDEDEESMQDVASGEDAPRRGAGEDDSEEDADFQDSDSDGGSPTSGSEDSEPDDGLASGDEDLAKAGKGKKGVGKPVAGGSGSGSKGEKGEKGKGEQREKGEKEKEKIRKKDVASEGEGPRKKKIRREED
ncbi:SSrecog-domain-containing protein [Dacryopinax primogenitus]|uniref:FACT complex subunit POB3 n=1 Tax=Dacryopinax primogenitus (strain DJM 731) TaxID=1858805 RepID=M5G1Y3_DACPD|nr:SSrecog-domain-containing protein [Dacryopinax primogenitus]EJT99906.1 SSrecog-domain-containing protein [Dacryopinax primogenitus]